MYYHNPYQSAPQAGRPKQATGQNYGYGQSYPSYSSGFYSEPVQPINPYLKKAEGRVSAPPVSTAAAPTAIAGPNVDPVPWTNQPLARIYVRPQTYTAATSAEETLRMGTAFPELYRPFNPGGGR